VVKRKAYTILWDDIALRELDRELHYLQKRSVDAPRIIADGILDKVKTIKIDPYICEADRLKLVNDGTYRAFIVFRYRVSYRILKDAIHILRIRHSSREPLEH
jgi:plasmid stabilization system protein ParE